MFSKDSFSALLRLRILWILTLRQTANFLLFHNDDNIKFDENGRQFSRRVENTVGKGEIAR